KTNEADTGIRKLLAAPPAAEISDYLAIIAKLNPEGGLRYYPGSPLLIAHR
ncbi:23S rRNA (adenine(2030)-N(6))-methyltransferase RlmJ, partial [Vibrio parahaemolyticus]